jgi:hypothetical protein
MTREDVGIMLDFFHVTENEFLTVAFITPIVFMMWSATFYFSSRFVKMGMDLWKRGDKK